MTTERSTSFEVFRDFILSTATRILFEKRRGGLHAVGEPERQSTGESEEDDKEEEVVEAYDENGNFIGAFNRFHKRDPKNPGARRDPKPNKNGQRHGAGGA